MYIIEHQRGHKHNFGDVHTTYLSADGRRLSGVGMQKKATDGLIASFIVYKAARRPRTAAPAAVPCRKMFDFYWRPDVGKKGSQAGQVPTPAGARGYHRVANFILSPDLPYVDGQQQQQRQGQGIQKWRDFSSSSRLQTLGENRPLC
ncbi:uncharacterized protein B0T23DRAFT_396657 [Neurospora hispaniola]|uniref:Uncharacterized protein n=1 Tax=Neurospora hispaniola TaxID=588809 RepID=A0AAJ0MQJ2_9PEZI|nr:hypothetical protein B0T23DRAFT_396657 [Neurospora hispaniola]